MPRDNQTRKIIILGSLGLILFLIFTASLSYSFVVFEKPAEAGDNSLRVQKRGEGDNKAFSYGLHLMSKGTYTAEVSSGISASRKYFDVKPFHIMNVKLSPPAQKNAQKIARAANECVFGDPKRAELGEIFSYDCFEPEYIFKNTYQNKSVKDTVVANKEASLYEMTPYGSGLLSISSGEEDNKLSYIDGSGQHLYPLPEPIAKEDPKSYRLAVDQGKFYLLSTVSKKVFTYNSLDSRPDEKQLAIKPDLNDKLTLFKLYDGKLYIISGEHAEGGNHEASENTTLYIVEDATFDKITSIKVAKLVPEITDFSVIGGNKIVLNSITQEAAIFDLDGAKLHEKVRLDSVVMSRSLHNKLYLLIDGAIYEYNPEFNSLDLDFRSENIQVSQIAVLGDRLIFNGQSTKETEPVNQTYLLRDTSINTDATYRLEDQLPYGDFDAPIESMDYLDKNMYVVLKLNSFKVDIASGKVSYDQAEFDKQKAVVSAKLASDGFKEGEYNISYNAY